MSTIALCCKGATRRHLGLERSWPLILPLGPNLTFLALWWWHLSLDGLSTWCPTPRAPLGCFDYGAHRVEVCGWRNAGDFVTKVGFQTCSLQSSKGSVWRLRRDKSPKKRKKNNTEHLDASHQRLEDFRSEDRAINKPVLLPPSPSQSTMVRPLQAPQPHGERHSDASCSLARTVLRCFLCYLL